MPRKTFDARVKTKHDTTANWNRAVNFVPLDGEIIVYDDYGSYTQEVNGETVTRYIPNIKIGDGLAYVVDLPFVNEDLRDQLIGHINNQDLHIRSGERDFWNDKVNIDDSTEISGELEGEMLIFTRL